MTCQGHAAEQERLEQQTPEPFGYFKAEPFGWTDCRKGDDGAVPLYDQATVDALTKERDELLAALEKFMDAHEECTGFDGYTAQIVSMDDYHEAQGAIASAKGGEA